MDNGDKPTEKPQYAFPLTDGETFANDGLTKREYFAGLAMQGILVNCYNGDESIVAEQSIKFADELLKQLNS